MGKAMSYGKRRFAGFLLVELIVALTVLAMLLAGVAFSLNGMAKFNRYQLIRQQCIAAAQAQLDSLTATGRSISEEDFSRLWPGLKVSIKETEGTGQWRGLKLVEVTASGKSFRKQVQIRLARYISRQIPLAEGK
jgi:type II secretory pathway pseudopilin PulG